MTIRVVIAEDHIVVRDGLKALLEGQADISVVGLAADGRKAVEVVREISPDVIVMDISMPGLNGIDAAHLIRKECPQTQVVILSMHATSEHIYRAFQAGALGYILKESAGGELIAAVREANLGRRFLSDRITDTLVTAFVFQGEEEPSKSPIESLSIREREVLQLAVEGKTAGEIAAILYLSQKTIETYRSRMMKKLGVKDFSELIRFAIQHGLTPLE